MHVIVAAVGRHVQSIVACKHQRASKWRSVRTASSCLASTRGLTATSVTPATTPGTRTSWPAPLLLFSQSRGRRLGTSFWRRGRAKLFRLGIRRLIIVKVYSQLRETLNGNVLTYARGGKFIRAYLTVVVYKNEIITLPQIPIKTIFCCRLRRWNAIFSSPCLKIDFNVYIRGAHFATTFEFWCFS